MFARYSRYAGTVRRLFLEEFAAEVPEGHRPFDGVEGERAAGLYERVFIGYGDDSIGQVGGAHLACEWVSNILTKVLQRGRLAAYLEQSTRYIPYDQPMEEGGGYRYYRDEELGEPYEAAMDELFRIYSRQPRGGSVVGGGALAAGRGARGRVAALDPRQVARPDAGRAPGLDAQPRRHLRLRPGLRAAPPSSDGLAAAGGARVRRHDPDRARQGDPELRRAHRATRSRRRMDRLPARAPAGHRARGGAAGAGPPRPRATRPRSSWSASRAARRTCSRPRCSSRRALPRPRSATGSRPSTRWSAPS